MRTTLVIFTLILFCKLSFSQEFKGLTSSMDKTETAAIIATANQYLNLAPQTVTATSCGRSAGGINDFYSEGDYWWPDPKNAEGPYIQRDGQSNPERGLQA